MRTKVGCPEPGEEETQRAWDTWISAWELAGFENGKATHEKTFWKVWLNETKLDAKAFIYHFVKLSLSEGDPSCQDELKARVVHEWLRETKDWIDRERAKYR